MQARERGPEETNPADTFTSGSQPPEPRNKFLSFKKHSVCGAFYGSTDGGGRGKDGKREGSLNGNAMLLKRVVG